MKLRQYQKEGIEFLSTRRYALLADDPGLGKTAQAVCALVETKAKKVLVICPAQVKYNWEREFEKWAPKHFSIGIINKSTDPLPRTNVLIANYALVVKKKLFDRLAPMVFDCIINDESHRLKNPTAQRTKKVLGKSGLVNRARKMWFMTGTPITNRPIDLYPLVARCMNGQFKPYNKYLSFAYRYCGAYQGPFGLVTTGATHLKELSERLDGFLLRRRKQDVLKELPRRIISHIEFDCGRDVMLAIEAEEARTQELAGDRDPEHYKLGEVSRIRRAVAKYKLKDAAGFIEDRLEEDKVVVFFYHKDVRKYLVEKFKHYKPLVIDGSVPAKKRTEIVDEFMVNKERRLFLGQMEAAGEGIDGLQHASSTCIFVEPSWLPKDMDQCISRLERMGQKNPVNAYILTIKNTIEAKMMKLLEWKLQNINVILKDNQTLKPTKENEMAKGKVYLEDKIDKLMESQAMLLKMVSEIQNGIALAPQATVTGDGDQVDDDPVSEQVNDDPEVVDSGEVSQAEVRSLASKIVKADKANGKTTCVNVIEGVAGKGKKLADCTPEQLAEVAEQFTEILNA